MIRVGSYHVCVYAICRDEARFARRWARSMREADSVLALDTGSTDETPRMLRAAGVDVREEEITPWRFDAARNRALALVPEDADICVSTDLDEEFRPGWRDALERAWTPDARRARFRYTRVYPERVEIWSDKIHARHGFRWERPAHEALECEDMRYKVVFAEGVHLYHRPDPARRRSLRALMELAVRERPDDDRAAHYLGREYLLDGMWKEAIDAFERHLRLPGAIWPGERAMSMRLIARAHIELQNPIEAERWLFRAIAEAPHLRAPWADMADLCRARGDLGGAAFFTSRATKSAVQ